MTNYKQLHNYRCNGLRKPIVLFNTVSLGFFIKCTASDDLVAEGTTNFCNKRNINTELFQDKVGHFVGNCK